VPQPMSGGELEPKSYPESFFRMKLASGARELSSIVVPRGGHVASADVKPPEQASGEQRVEREIEIPASRRRVVTSTSRAVGAKDACRIAAEHGGIGIDRLFTRWRRPGPGSSARGAANGGRTPHALIVVVVRRQRERSPAACRRESQKDHPALNGAVTHEPILVRFRARRKTWLVLP